jgi:hypothetical protein
VVGVKRERNTTWITGGFIALCAPGRDLTDSRKKKVLIKKKENHE